MRRCQRWRAVAELGSSGEFAVHHGTTRQFRRTANRGGSCRRRDGRCRTVGPRWFPGPSLSCAIRRLRVCSHFHRHRGIAEWLRLEKPRSRQSRGRSGVRAAGILLFGCRAHGVRVRLACLWPAVHPTQAGGPQPHAGDECGLRFAGWAALDRAPGSRDANTKQP